MWNDFTEAFSHKFTGTMYKRVELFVNELQTWVEWHDNAAQHRLHLTAFGVGMLAFFAGFGTCWFAFVR